MKKANKFQNYRMDLHVFNDAHGFNLNAVVDRFARYNFLNNHIFINLNNKSIFKNDIAIYLDGTISGYRTMIRQLPTIKAVSFYPLDYHAAFFLKELKYAQPAIKVNWVFWSYEYYHQPLVYRHLLDVFSLSYYKRKNSLLHQFIHAIKKNVKKLTGIPVYNNKLVLHSYTLVNDFYSFLPADFKNVKEAYNLQCQYHPISFLSIEEIMNGVRAKERTFPGEVMVGHAASLTANHMEVLDRLYEIKVPNKLFIPLEYGEKEYGEIIKKRATDLFGVNTRFLEQRLDINTYYQRLSAVSFAIFNFKAQEALGNILFLLWNGTKVFLRGESTVYQQFSQWGFTVYRTERDLNKENLESFLSQANAAENRRLIEEIMSQSRIDQYWQSLMR